MKNIKFLLIGTSLSCFPGLVFGQCVTVQDCTALGYTETSCPGNGVKCPFGNGWFCGGDEESICRENGFTESCNGAGQSGSGSSCGGLYAECSCDSTYQYTCSGTGYAGGTGSACGGKYTQCTCSSGYEWKNGTCQQQILNGADGDVYKCNGIVVGVKTPDMNFYVAMQDIGKMDWNSANSQCSSYIFCNSAKGTLPDIYQLRTIYKNKSTINNLLLTNGGTGFLERWFYWSSTYNGGSTYNTIDMFNGQVYSGIYGWETREDDIHYVRCVLTSW